MSNSHNGEHHSQNPATRLRELSKRFHLPTVADEVERRFMAAGHADALETLAEVFEMEAEDRKGRRIERLRRASHLPPGKTFDTLKLQRFPKTLSGRLRQLGEGEFVDRAENVLAFGLPGVGKSHAASAIGHELVNRGRSVYFTPTFELVQELLVAKRDLRLPRFLRKLDLFEVLVLDDIGYTQKTQEEVEVLFTLLAERYERRAMIITSNLVFSQWDQIFKNPMTTAAAIDRVVHHAVILEFNVRSYRAEEANERHGKGGGGKDAAPPTEPS
ncbi:MAG: IS21-like element helper ATPase IstB [Candidatus Xenobia bacterium]